MGHTAGFTSQEVAAFDFRSVHASTSHEVVIGHNLLALASLLWHVRQPTT